jgi:urease accessory protein
MVSIRSQFFAITLALIAMPAFAHPGYGDPAGFFQGFVHPLGGLDHILVMVAVGLLAYRLGGRALWLVPSVFVLAMGFGGLLGTTHAPLPYAEIAIAVSIIVVGAAIAFGIGAPTAVVATIVGLFAIFHGYAHGIEMPSAASAATYAAGFIMATILLHAAGIAGGFTLSLFDSTRLLTSWTYRVVGSLIAGAGTAILTQMLSSAA